MLESHKPLFQPIRINRLEIANRLVLAPIAAHSPELDGRPSSETFAFFERRVAAGVGLIILGGTTSTTHGSDGQPTTRYTLQLDRDEFKDDLRQLVDRVHRYSVPIFAQINTSMGRMGAPGPHFIAASAVNVAIPEARLASVMAMPGGLGLPRPGKRRLARSQRSLRRPQPPR